MNRIVRIVFGLFIVVCFFYPSLSVFAGPLDETRCCTVPIRDASGAIYRSSAVLTAFKKVHPCPANGNKSGPCPGWIMDHVVPLACGGADAVYNLQWLTVEMWRAKSLWERKIYGGNGMSPGCP